MRVAFSLDGLSSSPTGIGRYIRELGIALGKEVEDLVYTWQGRALTTSKSADPAMLVPSAGVASGLARNLSRWLYDRPRAAAMAQTILDGMGRCWPRDYHVDVVHGPKFYLPPTRGAFRVVTFHDLSAIRYPAWHLPGRAARVARAMEQVAPGADRIITDTAAVKAEVQQYFGLNENRVVAIALGVDPRFRPRSPEETEPTLARYGLRHQGYLLSVGSAEPRKNLEGLLDACRALPRRELLGCPLVLAGGEGWCNESLRQRFAEGCAEAWLRPLGFVAEDDLPLLFAGARGFVSVSFYEGFGLPVLEAMASGIPVLGSSVPAVAEVLGGVGLLVDPHDPKGIAWGMQRLMGDTAWAHEAGDLGRRRACEFTWQRCAAETANLYRELLR